jgi:UDP-glucose:glycoprotein glucosyltransferase
LPEWTVYDDEVAALARRIAEQQSAGSEGEIGAFGRKADELVQAAEQKAEQKKFDEEHAGERDQQAHSGVEHTRIKDEL